MSDSKLPRASVDEKFDDEPTEPKFARPGELTDLALLPGEFRAFRVETRDSLEGIARALQSLGRIEERIDVVIDRQNHFERRLGDVEARLSKLEQRPLPAARVVKRKVKK